MPRAKGGVKTRKSHNKWLELSKGHRGTRNNVYKKAREQAERSLAESYKGRKQRKRDFRRLWIVRINAAVRQHGLSYNTFMGLLKEKNIEVDRKMLSEMAINSPEQFAELVKQVQS
ncbi:50S ribosomal protein L20 [Limisalsivibrio acetivorans]|uniref:50S ribosomal protein L20 n=1 Tax=Limisalsivibrio acetivorans TaxID=1304888 RepID=UPI0003B39B1B|nr:50S ribosomal protein L20 [Limisalsivibrio acetivorans]